jgi:hypothetical protein
MRSPVEVLVNLGKLELDQRGPIPDWEEDERGQITVRRRLKGALAVEATSCLTTRTATYGAGFSCTLQD